MALPRLTLPAYLSMHHPKTEGSIKIPFVPYQVNALDPSRGLFRYRVDLKTGKLLHIAADTGRLTQRVDLNTNKVLQIDPMTGVFLQAVGPDGKVVDLPNAATVSSGQPEKKDARQTDVFLILNPKQMQHLQNDTFPDGRYTKEERGVDCSIFKDHGVLIGVLDGEDKILGQGFTGKAKLSQQFDGNKPGRWLAEKVQTIDPHDTLAIQLAKEEEDKLQLACLTPRHRTQSSGLIESPRQSQSPRTEHSPSPRHAQVEEVRRSASSPLRRSRSKKKLENTYTYPSLMRLVKGDTLQNILGREEWAQPEGEYKNYLTHPIISPLMRIEIAIQIVSAYMQFHAEKKLLHRDIKTGNAMFDLIKQKLQIVDMGSAAIMDASGKFVGQLIGNAEAMSASLRRKLAQRLQTGIMPDDVLYDKHTEAHAVGVLLMALYSLLRPRPCDEEGRPLYDQYGEDAFVADQDSPEYLYNNAIPKEFLAEILAEGRRLTANNLNPPAYLDKTLEVLQGIKQACLAAPNVDEMKNRVAVLSVSEYFELHPEQKQKLIEQLRAAHEVWLIDETERDVFEHIVLKNVLEDQGLLVGNQCFWATKNLAKAMSNLEKHLEQRPVPSICERVSYALALENRSRLDSALR